VVLRALSPNASAPVTVPPADTLGSLHKSRHLAGELDRGQSREQQPALAVSALPASLKRCSGQPWILCKLPNRQPPARRISQSMQAWGNKRCNELYECVSRHRGIGHCPPRPLSIRREHADSCHPALRRTRYHMPEGTKPRESNESFIRNKYERNKWRRKPGDPPMSEAPVVAKAAAAPTAEEVKAAEKEKVRGGWPEFSFAARGGAARSGLATPADHRCDAIPTTLAATAEEGEKGGQSSCRSCQCSVR